MRSVRLIIDMVDDGYDDEELEESVRLLIESGIYTVTKITVEEM